MKTLKKLALILCLTIPLFLLSMNANTQIVFKEEKIKNTPFIAVKAFEGQNYVETQVGWIAEDTRYRALHLSMIIFKGTPKEFYNFLLETKKFYENNEVGSLCFIKTTSISIYNEPGIGKCLRFGEENNRGGYYEGVGFKGYLKDKGIQKFIDNYLIWANLNEINIK